MSVYSKLSIYNARILHLKKFSIGLKEVFNENNKIQKLKIADKIVEVGEDIKCLTETFKIDSIIATNNKNAIVAHKIVTSKQTRSSTYLLPMLGFSIEQLGWNRYGSYVNTYLGNKITEGSYMNEEYVLHIMFRVTKLFEDNISKIEILKNSKYFIKEYKPDNTHLVYIFILDKKYHEDYKYFINGKYSMISDKYKKKILAFHGTNSGLLKDVLYKTEKLRKYYEEFYGIKYISPKQELGELVIIDDEIIKEKDLFIKKFAEILFD